jgi:hypothetical protein
MDVRLAWLLRTQDDLVAWWQLRALGWSEHRILHWLAVRSLVTVHDGVFACKLAPLTRRQRWFAAVLTAPGTLLGGHSAGACWGFRPWASPIESVVRHGSGGPRTLDGVYVRRSNTLADEIAWKDGIPITSVERTLIDLSPHLLPDQRAKAVREAIRLKLTTPGLLLDALDRHRGRRGTAPLRLLAEKYAALPLDRTRSDAEAFALERLFDANLPIPAVNERIGDYEADLIDHDRRLIVEIDGPQFHIFGNEDDARDQNWDGEGYRVIRIPSDSVFERP